MKVLHGTADGDGLNSRKGPRRDQNAKGGGAFDAKGRTLPISLHRHRALQWLHGGVSCFT